MGSNKAKPEQGLLESIKQWNQTHKQVYHLVLPVFANLMLTLFAWIYVYEMKVEKSPVSLLFLDSANNLTTGSDFFDGLLNGFACVASVAVLSFIMLGFAMYNFRRLIQCWLSLSCLLIMFCVSGSFFTHLLNKFDVNNLLIVAAMTLVYGIVGVFAFFTNKLPLAFHQFYVICNCSLVSLFYLQILPNYTTWFLLGGIVVWDIFAVLTPLGPLRQITGKAQDYSEDILRFLMFTTTVEETHNNNEIEERIVEEFMEEIEVLNQPLKEDAEVDEDLSHAWESERQVAGKDCSTEEECEISEPVKEFQKSAQDALNDSSARLGMGDFVFYSLLVGKAAVSGSIFATIGAIFGVLAGLIITLTVLTDGDETTPALPVSIFLGTTFHFGFQSMSFW